MGADVYVTYLPSTLLDLVMTLFEGSVEKAYSSYQGNMPKSLNPLPTSIPLLKLCMA